MFDNLYITSKNYIYNKKTGRIYKVTSDVKKVLNQYNGKKELMEKDPEIYEALLPILEVLNTPAVSENPGSSANSICEPGLSTLQLVVSNECNLACRYCYAHCGTYNRAIKKMDMQIATCAIDNMFSIYQCIDTITFFGGEPLLQIDLIENICEYLQAKYQGKYHKIGMMSNLYELSDKAIDVIKRYNISVATSLDGDEYHNAHRITKVGDNSFQQVASNIHRLYDEAKQPLAIEATMTNLHNDIGWRADDVTNYLAQEFPVANFTVNPMTSFDKKMKKLEYVSIDSPVDIAVEKFINSGVCDMRINDLVSVITGKMCGDMLCDAGRGQLSVFPNGDIFPCHIYSLDKEQRFCLGNVVNFNKHYFESKQKEVLAFNSKTSYDKCKECTAYNLCTSCMGMCLATALSLPHDDTYCESYRNYFDELIEIYVDLLEFPSKMDVLKKRLKEANVLCKSC